MKQSTMTLRCVIPAAVLLFLATAPDTQSWQDSPDAVGFKMARAVREPLGLGLIDCLPAMAGDFSHGQMIDIAIAWRDSPFWIGDEVVEAYGDARADLVRRITWSDEPGIGYEQLAATENAIAEGGVAVLTDFIETIPSDMVGLVIPIMSNVGFDRDLRGVTVFFAQRQQLRQAQRARDAVTLDARNWHDYATLDEAKEQFEAQVETILGEEQLVQLAWFREQMALRLDEMALAEAAADPFIDLP